ncbi:hypothetical protein SCHPADRAFT_932158 [Schizopora paradoxa]|uniref:F-box domain-containing protein n=1 Tax=Schizopora paradoxa TaxID=27342 RepID=A0A0H2R8Y2_9AGAM|nr:hypothetical protein SCHPADRAFT_932158 [Schizopora paradoxa]
MRRRAGTTPVTSLLLNHRHAGAFTLTIRQCASSETRITIGQLTAQMELAAKFKKSKEAGKTVENALDVVIKKLTALHDGQGVKGTVSLISAFEKRFSTSGFLHNDDVASETVFKTAKASYHELLAPLEQLVQELHTAQSDVNDLLQTFRSTCSTIGNLQQVVYDQLDCLSRGHGLARLPNEILSLIFKATISTSLDRRRMPFLLASVCRRFRGVAFSSPQLWSYVCTSWKNLEALEVRLLRSQEANLDIEIGSSDSYGAKINPEWFNTFLTLVGAHVRRWGRLAIRSSVSRCREDFDLLMQHLSSEGPLKLLPKLHHIEIDDLEKPTILFQHLERCAPNLHNIETNSIFAFTRNVTLPAAITTLSIDVRGSLTDKFNIRRLIGMLQAMQIEDLHLRFSSNNSFYGYKVQDSEDKKKNNAITTVKRLSLGIDAQESTEDVFRSLYFPSLTHLDLRINVFSRDDYDESDSGEEEEDLEFVLGISNTWFEGRIYSKLKSLSLKLFVESPKASDDPVDTYLEKDHIMEIAKSCPNLEDLELECTHWTESLKLPPLRSLTLNKVNIEDDWIQEYGEELKEIGKWDSFQRLTINRCKAGDVFISEKKWCRQLADFGNKLVVIT